MNVIKVHNVKSILPSLRSLEINTEKGKRSYDITIVIFSEEDIDNINTLYKLKGATIDVLVIPKKHRFIFNESEYYKYVKYQLTENYTITYY